MVYASRFADGRDDLVRDVRGVTAIEFAIVSPVFIAAMLACLQTALVMFTQEAMQTATEYAARRLSVGEAQRAGETADQFRAKACSQLPAYLACSGLKVDVRHAATLGALDTAAPPRSKADGGMYRGPTGYSPGGADDYVLVRLVYVWNISVAPLGFDLSDVGPGKRLMIATMVVKTESYKS